MCGIGVVSLIDIILNPLACKALKAVSLPDPGPLTSTDKIFMPTSKALAAAASAATCAAYGVDLREPLKPFGLQMPRRLHFHLYQRLIQ